MLGVVETMLAVALLVMLPLSWQRQRTRAKELLALAAEQKTLHHELVATIKQRRSGVSVEKQISPDEPAASKSEEETSRNSSQRDIWQSLRHHQYENLRFEKDGAVGRVILNRPEKMNGVNDQLRDEILDALGTCATDPEIRVVMLRGAGRAFCAGADLRETRGRLGISPATAIIRAIRELPKPVLAVVHGYAVGEGFEIALACDIRIAAEGTKLGLAGVKYGIVPSTYGMALLVQVVGLAYAANILLTEDWVEVEQASRIGLIHEVVPLEELGACADRWSERLQQGTPAATAFVKSSLTKIAGWARDENLEILASQLAETLRERSRSELQDPRNPIPLP